MSLALLGLTLALIKPMPAPGDARAGEAATACIFYYRLQDTFVPGGSAGCEAQGYGLDFMRAHWAEIAALEAKRQRQFDAELARAHRIAALMREKPALEGPCFAMVLDGGPGPDGGAEVCALVGFTHDMVTRTARHRAYLADQAARQRRRRWLPWAGAGLAAGMLMVAAAALWRRR